jgi:2-amino-4-hydroxy-6-hydroxymethyldihydropteridine diphosphokinase
MSVTAYLSLGSNLGSRLRNIICAIRLLSSAPMTRLIACSEIHQTAPQGGPKHQPDFFNACIAIRTRIPPHKLLKYTQTLERLLGRKRKKRWGPRTLDIDILLYGRAVLQKPDIRIPHPRMHIRRFVLEPLCEFASNLRHPEIRLTIAQLLQSIIH